MMNMKQAAAIMIGGVLIGGVTCFWFSYADEKDPSLNGQVGYEVSTEETDAARSYDFSDIYRKFCDSDFTYTIYEGEENPLQLSSETDVYGEVTYGDCFVDETFFDTKQTGYGIRVAASDCQYEKTDVEMISCREDGENILYQNTGSGWQKLQAGERLSAFYILEDPDVTFWGSEIREGAMNYDLYEMICQPPAESQNSDTAGTGSVLVYYLCDMTDGTICQIILDFSQYQAEAQTPYYKVIDSISYSDDLEIPW